MGKVEILNTASIGRGTIGSVSTILQLVVATSARIFYEFFRGFCKRFSTSARIAFKKIYSIKR